MQIALLRNIKRPDVGLDLSKTRTRKMEPVKLMDSIVPWPQLVAAHSNGTFQSHWLSVICARVNAAPAEAKGHAGVDADSGLVHSVAITAANTHDVTQASELLHGKEPDVFANSGYRGREKHEEIQAMYPNVNWYIAIMPGKRRALKKDTLMGAILDKLEQIKARIRTKAKHPFRVNKRQFGYNGAIPWAGQEHGSAIHSVHADQPLDVEIALLGTLGGMSAPKNGQQAEIAGERTSKLMTRTLNSSRLTPPFRSNGIHAT